MMPFKEGDSFAQRFHLSPAVYQNFINTFQDQNPLHTDSSFARKKGFRDKVMHGNILGGFLSYFVGECLPTKEVIIHKQEIKFKKPVYEGDHLLLEASVTNVHESVGALEIKFHFLRDGEKMASGSLQVGLLP